MMRKRTMKTRWATRTTTPITKLLLYLPKTEDNEEEDGTDEEDNSDRNDGKKRGPGRPGRNGERTKVGMVTADEYDDEDGEDDYEDDNEEEDQHQLPRDPAPTKDDSTASTGKATTRTTWPLLNTIAP
jgi:hypothetical protein